jgi:hypothetical protein
VRARSSGLGAGHTRAHSGSGGIGYIKLTPDPNVKLLDFGLAKPVDEDANAGGRVSVPGPRRPVPRDAVADDIALGLRGLHVGGWHTLLMVVVKEESRAARLNVMLNWFEELKARVPMNK